MGNAVDAVTGEPVAGVPVSVRILVDGTRRELFATTDAIGSFQITFQPLPFEAGQYSLAADHPAVVTDTVQDTFQLVGMRAMPDELTVRLVPETPATGQIDLRNLSGLPLSGITVNVVDAPANVTVQTTLSSTLAGHGTAVLSYEVTAADASIRRAQARILIDSIEGETLEVPLDISVIPLTANLVANPGFINRGMLRGVQTIVSFDVTNTGGAPSEILNVNLPDAPWMSLLSAATIGPIAPGQKVTITLALRPAADLPLGLYEGNLSLDGPNSSLSQAFSLRAISEAVGDVRISVQDEYTYYVDGAPLVAGAIVTLRDPFDNSIVVTEATTDASGRVTLFAVAEGNYLLEVQAEKHGTYRELLKYCPASLTKQRCS